MNNAAIINLEVLKIYLNAKKISDYICKKIHIKSDLIFYEEIFYFYFLSNSVLCINNYPVEVTHGVGPSLFKYLENTNMYSTNQNIKLICFHRFKKYIDILLKYDEKFTPDFFLETFNYQSELIVTILNNNSFMDMKVNPSLFSEWINKASVDKTYIKITKLLGKKINIFNNFINI